MTGYPSFVKIPCNAHHFWVRDVEVNPFCWTGVVDTALVPGFEEGARIKFQPNEIEDAIYEHQIPAIKRSQLKLVEGHDG